MKITVNISPTLQPFAEGLPSKLVVEKSAPLTIAELTAELKIPALLIAIAAVDGVKCSLDLLLEKNAEIDLIGPIAGG